MISFLHFIIWPFCIEQESKNNATNRPYQIISCSSDDQFPSSYQTRGPATSLLISIFDSVPVTFQWWEVIVIIRPFKYQFVPTSTWRWPPSRMLDDKVRVTTEAEFFWSCLANCWNTCSYLKLYAVRRSKWRDKYYYNYSGFPIKLTFVNSMHEILLYTRLCCVLAIGESFNLILHNNLALFFTALYRGSYYKSSHTDDAKKEQKSSFYSKSNLATWLKAWLHD